jgi:hypothetical protein
VHNDAEHFMQELGIKTLIQFSICVELTILYLQLPFLALRK